MKVAYKGNPMTDAYVLDANDLKKAGVEGFKKTTFPTGEPVEVSDEVGKVLTSDEGIFASHNFVEVTEDEAKEADSDDDLDDEDDDEVDSSSTQQVDGTGATDASSTTGNGSSTAGTGAAKKTAAKKTSSSTGSTS